MEHRTLIHFTKKENVKSIKENGLLPMKPWIPNHYAHFGRNVIYTIPFSNRHENTKAGVEHIYFQTKYKPRLMKYIDMFPDWDNLYNGIHYSEYGKVIDILRMVPLDFSDYYMLKFCVNEIFEDVVHGQFANENWNPDFPDKFSHHKQPLTILDKKVEWKDIEIVGECEPIRFGDELKDIKVRLY